MLALPMLFIFFAYLLIFIFMFFFFNDTATTEIYTLSLHDALPISRDAAELGSQGDVVARQPNAQDNLDSIGESPKRSEEHTSELQSRSDLVCRLLLEKKKNLCHVVYILASIFDDYVSKPGVLVIHC